MDDNKLIQEGIAAPTNITNIKENTENNISITGSNVTFNNANINVSMPQSALLSNDAEKILAMHSFSHEYYQLLVTTEEDIFDTGVISFPVNRALTHSIVPPEIFDRCSSLDDDGIRELRTFPALICKENRDWNGITSSDEVGWLGYIKKVQKSSRVIKVVFGVITPVSHSVLCDKKNAVYFDLNMDSAITTLNTTAWSVHKADLFEAFDEAGVYYPKLK